MADWPSILPNLSYQGYKLQTGSQVIRTDMDNGIARQRRRFTARVDVIDCILEVKGNELDIFEDFIYNDCNGGASWFNAPISDGSGVQTKEVRVMGGNYTFVPLDQFNKVWNVQMKLEVRNR